MEEITLIDENEDHHLKPMRKGICYPAIFDYQGNIFSSDSEIRYIDIDKKSDIIHLKKENV